MKLSLSDCYGCIFSVILYFFSLGNFNSLRNALRWEGVVGFVTNRYGKMEGDLTE